MTTLDMPALQQGTLQVHNKLAPQYAGGISSLRNSWAHSSPYPVDTISYPEVRVSVRENNIVVSLNAASEITSAKWIKQTVLELAQLLWLPKDWNSDNPEKISPGAIEKILAILLSILDPDSSPPKVVPTSRGGVQVEWHQNGIDLEIEAFNSNKLEYFFSGPTGDKEGTIGEDSSVLEPFKNFLKRTHTLSPSR